MARKPKIEVAPPALVLALTHNLGKPEGVLPGQYPVRGEVRFAVDCVVTLGEPTSARASVRVDPAKLLAAFLHVWGVKAPGMDRLHELVGEAFALAAKEEDESFAAMGAVIDGALTKCKEQAAESLERVPRAGVCRAPGMVEMVGWVPNP